MKTKISRRLVNEVIRLESKEPFDVDNHSFALSMVHEYCRSNGLWYVNYMDIPSLAYDGLRNGAKEEDIIKGIELILNCEVVYE